MLLKIFLSVFVFAACAYAQVVNPPGVGPGSGGTVTGVTATAPINSSGGTAPVISGTYEGNGSKIQLFTGTDPATNDCAKFDANHNVVGAGAACTPAFPAGPGVVVTSPAGVASAVTASYAIQSANFVFEGDSLTHGVAPADGANAYPAQASSLPPFTGHGTVTNIAISGTTCEQVASRYTANAHPLSPAVTGLPGYFFVMCGSNNIAADGAPTAYTALQGIWSAAKADGYKVIAYTIPYAFSTDATNLKVNAYNALIRQGGVTTTPLYDYFVDVANILSDPYNQTYFQSDHIHFTAGTNSMIARRVADTLTTLGGSSTGMNSFHYESYGSGSSNIRLNLDTLLNQVSGSNNTAGGESSLQALTTGSDNTGYGNGACGNLTDGGDNVCVGHIAGGNTTSSSQMVYVGRQAGAASTASNTVGVGAFALASATGNGNTAIGNAAGASVTSGTNNSFIGSGADGSTGVTGAVQLGAGTNSTNNTVQFQSFNFLDSSGNGTFLKTKSSTNCSSAASPAVCGSASSGSFVVAASATSVVVNTTGVTANSQIFVFYDASLGTKLGVTCNTTIPALYGVSARTAGTSFTLASSASITNPACFSYTIVN